MSGPGVSKAKNGKAPGRGRGSNEGFPRAPEPLEDFPREELPEGWRTWPSVHVVAPQLGLKVHEVRNLVAEGRLAPPRKFPDGTSRYDPAVVQAFVEARKGEQVKSAELVSAAELMRLCIEQSARADARAEATFKAFHDNTLQLLDKLTEHLQAMHDKNLALQTKIDEGQRAREELASEAWARDMALREFDHKVQTRKTALSWIGKAFAAKFNASFDALKTQVRRATQGEAPSVTVDGEMVPPAETSKVAVPAWKRLFASLSPEQREQIFVALNAQQIDVLTEMMETEMRDD